MGWTEPAGAWGWKLQPRGLLAPAGKLGGSGGELGPRGLEEGRGEASVPTEPALAPGQRPAQHEPGHSPQPHAQLPAVPAPRSPAPT